MRTNKRTMLKRTAAAVLCAAFLLPMALPSAVYAGNVQAGAQTGTQAGMLAGVQTGAQTGADKTLARIQLSVGDGQETPVFRAGEKAKLRISVKNTGNTDAQNVRIAPVIKSEADWPFELDQLNYDQDLGAVQAGEKADIFFVGLAGDHMAEHGGEHHKISEAPDPPIELLQHIAPPFLTIITCLLSIRCSW